MTFEVVKAADVGFTEVNVGKAEVAGVESEGAGELLMVGLGGGLGHLNLLIQNPESIQQLLGLSRLLTSLCAPITPGHQ